MGIANQAKRQARLQQLGLRGKLPDALTERVLEAVRTHPLGERYSLSDGAVPGLELQVAADGAASFLLHYRTKDGRQRHIRIAGAGAMPLVDVRAAAQGELVRVRAGADPAEEKRQARAQSQLAKSSTVRAYLENVYAPKVLAHRKDGGKGPRVSPRTGKTLKPSGTWGRITSTWAPLLDAQLGALQRDAIEKVLADRKVAGTAMGTLLRDWSAFRAMLADAVDRGQLAAVPMARRPEPIRKGKGNQRVRWLGQFDTDEQLGKNEGERTRFTKSLEAFSSAEPCGGDFLRFAARVALATGMRRGEIVRLADAMINLRERTIALPHSITKSDKGRIVYLGDAAIAALKGWTLRGTRGELCPGNAENWEDRITQREWPALAAAAAITDLHFHDLRHDFAVRMLRSGATLEQVRDALGHASITQTEKYAHVVPSDVRQAVLRMTN
ncbi:MAG: tyrosine-type recombinase/integrase [Myxococcales bacterium]|nr:site-specific integrase [Myxococcales bacterium]